VWLPGSGWTPVDPADVRKVVLEEPPGNLGMTDPKVVAARKALFGSWEGNPSRLLESRTATLVNSRWTPWSKRF
jgi:transglutaminase-like putative cysteine protease